jgi:hypothetical protein
VYSLFVCVAWLCVFDAFDKLKVSLMDGNVCGFGVLGVIFE